MGSSESTLSNSQGKDVTDEITTISERIVTADPSLERLSNLKIATPILKKLPSEGTLTDILIRKPSTKASGLLNPNILLELFGMFNDWQDMKTRMISQKQEEIENKIEVVDALAVKLLQRFTYSDSAMRKVVHHLCDVESLEIEVGELKGRMTAVISNCDALCRRIAAEGPEPLRSSLKPFAVSSNLEPSSSLVRSASFK